MSDAGTTPTPRTGSGGAPRRPVGDDALLSVEQAARRLCLDEPVVRALVEAGHIPAVRLGARWRIPPEGLRAFRLRIVRGEVPRDITPVGGVVLGAPRPARRGGNRGGNSAAEPRRLASPRAVSLVRGGVDGDR
jgi:excisionase family DNA binding protein